jgi:hypothetical protein
VLSTVTCRSSMHSSRADWVLGEARLISSPTTMLAKTPPGRNSNSRVFWLKTETPVTSEGNRSGVNWMRRTVQSIDRARALLSMVLPTPGTSSRSRCPSASITTSAVLITSLFPSITRSTLARTLWVIRASVSRSAPSEVLSVTLCLSVCCPLVVLPGDCVKSTVWVLPRRQFPTVHTTLLHHPTGVESPAGPGLARPDSRLRVDRR